MSENVPPLLPMCENVGQEKNHFMLHYSTSFTHTHTTPPPPHTTKNQNAALMRGVTCSKIKTFIYRNGSFLRLYRLTVYVYWLIDQLFNLYLSAVIWVSSHSFHFFSCSPPPLLHSLTPSPILLSLLLFLSLSVVCTVSIFALFCQGYSGQTEQFINSLCSLTVLAVSGHTFRKPY